MFLLQVRDILPSLGRVSSDSFHFRLSRDYSRLQLNRKPYFLSATHDHFLIMHKLNAKENDE